MAKNFGTGSFGKKTNNPYAGYNPSYYQSPYNLLEPYSVGYYNSPSNLLQPRGFAPMGEQISAEPMPNMVKQNPISIPSDSLSEAPESDMSKYLGYLKDKDKIGGIGGIVSGAASLGQGVMSLIQGGKLKDEANAIDTTRPIYRYSSGIDENVANARQAYSSGQMAGQNEMQNNIQANQANSVSQLLNSGLDPSQVTAMTLGTNQNTNTALNNVGIQKANFINQSRGALGQALGKQAQFRDQQFGYNVDEPYRERVARKNALLRSGAEASNTGMDKLISGGVGAGLGVASLLI